MLPYHSPKIGILPDLTKIEKKRAAPGIDFADSELRSFTMAENNNLIIYIDSWDERIIKLSFSNTLSFIYTGGFQITDIYEIMDSPSLNERIIDYYGKIPDENRYRLFQIENLYTKAFIEVIATELSVVKGSEIGQYI